MFLSLEYLLVSFCLYDISILIYPLLSLPLLQYLCLHGPFLLHKLLTWKNYTAPYLGRSASSTPESQLQLMFTVANNEKCFYAEDNGVFAL